MIGLPPALRSWADDLAIFPEDVALSIAPWLPSIAASIGRLATRSDDGAGDPDGFVGLSRRGPYDRLLLSEWLLADGAPDEFVRRAAMSEHSFLELARTKPEGSTRSLALFDAGPHQIGAPRIAHLAALIVLHRRAHEAGAAFWWGVLQDGERSIYETVDEQSVRSLLLARSAMEAGTAVVESWLDQMGCDDYGEEDDLWVVGGRRTEKIVSDASQFLVHDVIEPGARRLRVEVKRRRDLDRHIELELPEPRAATRLLRNPFEVKTKFERGPAPTNTANSPLRFDHVGRRLFIRYGFGVRVFPLPEWPQQAIAAPRHLGEPDSAVLAVGGHRHASYLLSVRNDDLMLIGYSKRGLETFRATLSMPDFVPIWYPGEDTPLGLLIPRGRGAPPKRFIWYDPTGRLFRIDPAARTVTLLREGVLDVHFFRGHVFAIHETDDGGDIFEIDMDSGALIRRHFDSPLPVRVVFGDEGLPTMFNRRSDGTWAPVGYSHHAPLTMVHPDERPLCIGRTEIGGRQQGLVTIMRGSLRVVMHTHDEDAYIIWESDAPIVAAAARAPFVAVTTSDEELFVIHVNRGRTASFPMHRAPK